MMGSEIGIWDAADPEFSFVSQEEQKGTIDGELATVIASVSLACKQIASLVNRAGISNLTGVAGQANVQVRGSATLQAHDASMWQNILQVSWRSCPCQTHNHSKSLQ